MAICEKCGKEYLTKECLRCKNKEYTYNKKMIDSINIKEKMNLLKIAFVIFIFAAIAAGTLIVYKIAELEKINASYSKKIDKLESENKTLKRSKYVYKKLADDLKKQNIELVHQIRNKPKYSYQQNKKYIKPKKEIKYINKNHQKKNYTNSPTRKKYTKNVQRKIYYKYKGYEKLISDSNIQIRNDNRLKSNSPIYGIYKHPLSLNITCGNNKKIYKIMNECSANSSYAMDKLYFKKSNKEELKNFNEKTHKIECQYDQKYGLMHNCRTKIF